MTNRKFALLVLKFRLVRRACYSALSFFLVISLLTIAPQVTIEQDSKLVGGVLALIWLAIVLASIWLWGLTMNYLAEGVEEVYASNYDLNNLERELDDNKYTKGACVLELAITVSITFIIWLANLYWILIATTHYFKGG